MQSNHRMLPQAALSFIATVLCVSSLSSCSSKAMTRPRSEVIAEAQSQGLPIATVEEDRTRFFAADAVNKSRLLALLRTRSQNQNRDSSYRIGPQDEVEINVFDVPELNVTARVRESGFISLPLIGAVQAAGLTDNQLHDELAKRLASYVRDPQVTVFVSNFGSQKVAVMGAVRNPGTYPLKKGSNSVLELISQAGGISDRAGNLVNFIPAELSGISSSNDVEARARLALANDSGQQVMNSGIEIYLDQILGTTGGIPLEIPVKGGDMVVVPEAGKIMVEGEVQKVGQYDLGQQMTLLSALAASGGITYGAKVDEVEVIREAGIENKAHLVLSLEKVATGEERDIRLRNGDIVRVPSDSGRRMTQDTFEGISRILNFGVGGNVNIVN